MIWKHHREEGERADVHIDWAGPLTSLDSPLSVFTRVSLRVVGCGLFITVPKLLCSKQQWHGVILKNQITWIQTFSSITVKPTDGHEWSVFACRHIRLPIPGKVHKKALCYQKIHKLLSFIALSIPNYKS